MPTITWLHLSDLHFRVDPAHSWDRDQTLLRLLEDIQGQKTSEGLNPDLVFISGDLAFSGAREEYALAARFLHELLDERLGLSWSRLALVPGNHDVARDVAKAEMLAIRGQLDKREAMNLLMSDPQKLRLLGSRYQGYTAFWRKSMGRTARLDPLGMYSVRRFGLGGKQVAVVGLNSAWLAYGGADDQGRLALGEQQVTRALQEADQQGRADLRIAVMHHPLAWLRDFDGADCGQRLNAWCQILLRGHLHRSEVLSLVSPDSRVLTLASGAAYETREARNAYNWVRIDVEQGRGVVHLRAYNDQRGAWVPDRETYRDAPEGTYSFTLAGMRSQPEVASGAAGLHPPTPNMGPQGDAAGTAGLQSRPTATGTGGDTPDRERAYQRLNALTNAELVMLCLRKLPELAGSVQESRTKEQNIIAILEHFGARGDFGALLRALGQDDAAPGTAGLQSRPPTAAVTGSFRQAKMEALRRRLASLMQEYQAASRQLEGETNPVARVRLQNQLGNLEPEISQAEAELRELES